MGGGSSLPEGLHRLLCAPPWVDKGLRWHHLSITHQFRHPLTRSLLLCLRLAPATTSYACDSQSTHGCSLPAQGGRTGTLCPPTLPAQVLPLLFHTRLFLCK